MSAPINWIHVQRACDNYFDREKATQNWFFKDNAEGQKMMEILKITVAELSLKCFYVEHMSIEGFHNYLKLDSDTYEKVYSAVLLSQKIYNEIASQHGIIAAEAPCFEFDEELSKPISEFS